MRPILRYLQNQYREAFWPLYYLATLLFLALFLYINFSQGWKKNVLNPIEGGAEIAAYFAFYAVPYFGTLLLYTFLVPRWEGRIRWWSKREFWLLALFGLLVLALDGSQPYRELFYQGYTYQTLQWAYQVVANLWSLVTVALPLGLFYLWRRERSRFYGLLHLRTDLRPYGYMLVLMVPLLAAASFLPSFQAQYPMHKAYGVGFEQNLPEWLMTLGFELAYALDFVTVELLFRGFFVVGMVRVLGREAILPMAAMYCFLHFGKPLGEAISSIFGGYILGVAAYESRSVWGGVLVHVGIAWGMELAAWAQQGFPL